MQGSGPWAAVVIRKYIMTLTMTSRLERRSAGLRSPHIPYHVDDIILVLGRPLLQTSRMLSVGYQCSVHSGGSVGPLSSRPTMSALHAERQQQDQTGSWGPEEQGQGAKTWSMKCKSRPRAWPGSHT